MKGIKFVINHTKARVNFYQILFLIFLWIIAVFSRIYTSGTAYGFDFSVFQPDGVLYALRTFMFMGENQITAARLIENWYFTHGSSGQHFDPLSILPSNTPAWGLVAPRVLYPLLSVPFLWAFGMYGLLVIPILSLLCLVLCLHAIGKIKGYSAHATFLGAILLISPTVLRWMVANITDALFVALFALVCLVIESRMNERKTFVYLTILVILTNLTRFATPIWLAIAAVEFIDARRRRAAVLAITALIATIPTFLTQPSNSVLPREGNLTVIEKVLALPISFIKVLFYEVAQLAVMDRFLLAILALAFALSVANLRSATNQRFLFILGATWAIGALNGSIGVNFRYQLPVVIFACAVLVSRTDSLRDWFFGSVRNIRGKEAQ
jgi:hypothetical protein